MVKDQKRLMGNNAEQYDNNLGICFWYTCHSIFCLLHTL